MFEKNYLTLLLIRYRYAVKLMVQFVILVGGVTAANQLAYAVWYCL